MDIAIWRCPPVVVPATAESGSLIKPLFVFLSRWCLFPNGQRENRLSLFGGVSSNESGVDIKFPGGGDVSRKKSISSLVVFLSLILFLHWLSESERVTSVRKSEVLGPQGDDFGRSLTCGVEFDSITVVTGNKSW